MKKLDRQEAIYKVALAGVSAAVALIFVVLSVFVRFSTVAFYIAAGIALMVPLTKKYYASSIFAFVVSGTLGFVIAGDIITVVGYIAYFGPVAILTGVLCNLRVKWYIQLPVKLVYINGALALMYFVCHTIVVSPAVMETVPYWLIALLGSVILALIDILEQFMYVKLAPKIGRFLRPRKKETSPAPEPDEDPYEEELYSYIESAEDKAAPQHPDEEFDINRHPDGESDINVHPEEESATDTDSISNGASDDEEGK